MSFQNYINRNNTFMIQTFSYTCLFNKFGYKIANSYVLFVVVISHTNISQSECRAESKVLSSSKTTFE